METPISAFLPPTSLELERLGSIESQILITPRVTSGRAHYDPSDLCGHGFVFTIGRCNDVTDLRPVRLLTCRRQSQRHHLSDLGRLCPHSDETTRSCVGNGSREGRYPYGDRRVVKTRGLDMAARHRETGFWRADRRHASRTKSWS